MRQRVSLALCGTVAAAALVAPTAYAQPIEADVITSQGGASIVFSSENMVFQTIFAGLGQGEDGSVGGLCAEGVIHESCTPADDVAD